MENIFGILAGAFGISSLIPQVYKSYKTKQTRDLSSKTFVLIAIGNLLWMIHAIVRKDAVLFITNLIAVGLALAIVVAKLKYK